MRRLLLALPLSACAVIMPAPETLELETRRNQPVALGSFAFWDASCAALLVQIETVEVPERGIVDIERAPYTIPDAVPEGSPEGCTGQRVEGRTLSYVPDADWTGTDRVTLIARGGNQAIQESYVIKVR